MVANSLGFSESSCLSADPLTPRPPLRPHRGRLSFKFDRLISVPTLPTPLGK